MPEPITAEQLRSILARVALQLYEQLTAGARPTGLPPLQARILAVMTSAPQASKEIARAIRHRYDTSYRRSLRALVDAGHVRHTSQGYSLP